MGSCLSFVRLAALLLAVMQTGAGARAQDYDDPSGRTLAAIADVRLTGADGERAWTDGGFGKARYGGTQDGDVRFRPRAVEGSLVWSPHIAWSLDGRLAVIAQADQDHAADLSEAFLSWRGAPGSIRLSARAGYFWPPVSHEHGGPEWRVSETITPSAINSWIGEEVKVGGLEATATMPLAGGKLGATVAIFGFNDTAGTLLAFRGWALHDQKGTAFGKQRLPTLDGFMQGAQAPRTRPAIELDDRPGFYGKLAWSPGKSLHVDAFYYDNRGDPQAVDADRQWGWRTRFGNIGATLDATDRLRLTAQAMAGRTEMGFPMADHIWVDTRFRSAFLLATRRFGEASLSARAEAFGTRGRGSVTGADDSEDGWAATLAARRPVGDHVTILAELLHVDSDRDARSRDGLAAAQRQTVVQCAIRVRL
jgi:hypothetical protein